MRTWHKRPAQLLCSIALAGATVLPAACGSSSPTPPASTGARRVNAAQAAATAAAKAHRDTVTQGAVTHQPLRGTGGKVHNDDNPGRSDVGGSSAESHENPCGLVSAADAQAIVGGPLATPQEAPLGPTCIYQPVGAKTFITVMVDAVDLATLKVHIRQRTRIRVSGHPGYCGIYGQPTTFVPLTHGRVLEVTGPCEIGKLFAAKALSRLTRDALHDLRRSDTVHDQLQRPGSGRARGQVRLRSERNGDRHPLLQGHRQHRHPHRQPVEQERHAARHGRVQR